MGFGLLGLGFVVNEPPVEERIIDKGLQDGHQGVLVPAEHIHCEFRDAAENEQK